MDNASATAPVWGLLDARGVDASLAAGDRIAGLTLVARHARRGARAKWAGMVIRVDGEEQRAALASAIARQPPPREFPVEYAVGDELAGGRDYLAMEIGAIYDPEAYAAGPGEAGEARARVRTAADAPVAQRSLFAMVRKSLDMDGFLSYFALRPIARVFTRRLINTGVSPNHVTSTAMLLAIVTAVCAGIGSYASVVAAGALCMVNQVLDCVDGDLARLRLQSSKLGEWLDTLTDDVTLYGLLAGLGVGILRTGAGDAWGIAALICVAVGIPIHIKLYADLRRMGGTIDIAQYPWFFGTPGEGAGSRDSLGGKLFYGIQFLFRRDSIMTMITLLFIADLRWMAVAILALGVAIIAVLFVVHHVLLVVRPPS